MFKKAPAIDEKPSRLVSMSAVDDVARYLGSQEQHHRRRTFEQEFIEFLRRHHLEYDKRHVFD